MSTLSECKLYQKSLKYVLWHVINKYMVPMQVSVECLNENV